jgi:hypothetical protein
LSFPIIVRLPFLYRGKKGCPPWIKSAKEIEGEGAHLKISLSISGVARILKSGSFRETCRRLREVLWGRGAPPPPCNLGAGGLLGAPPELSHLAISGPPSLRQLHYLIFPPLSFPEWDSHPGCKVPSSFS